jgi:hypothetical protein
VLKANVVADIAVFVILVPTPVFIKAKAGTFAFAALASDQWVDLKAGGLCERRALAWR